MPGLNILTLLSITLTTVDSKPISTIPSSIIVETFPSNSFNISSILVPLGLPDTFALGAAIGTPAYSINLFAILFEGILIPTVSRPAVTDFGIMFLAFNINVKGPGQKVLINIFSTSFGSSTSCLIMSTLFTCTIKGLSPALPFALKIFLQALSFNAFAPIPYTVSVGNITSFPFSISCAASFIFSSLYSSFKFIYFVFNFTPSNYFSSNIIVCFCLKIKA